jgi:hypothetical protein
MFQTRSTHSIIQNHYLVAGTWAMANTLCVSLCGPSLNPLQIIVTHHRFLTILAFFLTFSLDPDNILLSLIL